MTAADLREVPPPRRLPPPAERPRVAQVQLAAALTWLAMGAALLIGPGAWRSSPSYQVIAAILPLPVWGALFVVIGAGQLLAAWRRRPGHGLIVGAAVATAWATSLVAAALVGRLAGFAAPILWTFLAAAQILEANEQHRRR